MGSPGEVYILHNCSFWERLVKIGLTTRTADLRARELSGTSVPDAFLVLFSLNVEDAEAVEGRLHRRFADFRYNDRREFFMVSPQRAILALLEEGGRMPPLAEPEVADRADILSDLHALYGPLLRPGLMAVALEHNEIATTLVCGLASGPDTSELRRDLEIISGSDDVPYFAGAHDAPSAAALFLALDAYSLVMTTPLFSPRGAQLIADLVERARLGENDILAIVQDARTDDEHTLDALEAAVRDRHSIPVRQLQAVNVVEASGRFLLSSTRQAGVRDLRIEAERADAQGELASYAVITRSEIDLLEPFDAVEVGYRESPRTWLTDGPRIVVSGYTMTGIPFRDTFTFFP